MNAIINSTYFGELCALSAAICWSIAVIIFKSASKSLSPLLITALKNTIALLDSWIEQVEHDVTSPKDVWLLFIKITRKGTYILYPIRKLGRVLFHGARYKQYWFCEMNYFFSCYKDELDLRWKGDYGRQTEED